MSNIGMIIEERPASLGSFLVGRLLPFRNKRMVGPYIFIDHMGPVSLKENENLDVGPHPHIGLSTLTYLFEGSIMHRDSLGTIMEIKPGAVNWMTAGKGVVHSERTPDYLRDSDKYLHGLQIWVALPKELEFMEPSFHHIEAHQIPTWEEDGVIFRLIAGQFSDYQSAVPVYSPQYFLELQNPTDKDVTLNLGSRLFGESGLYILHGSIEAEGNTFEPKQILVANDTTLCSFVLKAHSQIYIFGGEKLPEERFIYWNFVATELETIEKAKQKWRNQEFDPVPEETDYTPLPEDSALKMSKK